MKINDSPQRIALGFGLGVFLGVLPVTGPLASVVLAALFRVNKAAALLGSLFTNTWLGVVTFLLAIRIGAFLLRLSGTGVLEQIKAIFADFHWQDLLNTAILKILAPLALGYLVIAFLSALAAYALVLFLFARKNKR